jgi:hypothetical protein
MKGLVRSKLPVLLMALVTVAVAALPLATSVLNPTVTHAAPLTFPAKGGLDCNGYSKIQQPIRLDFACADMKGHNGGRGEDNGHYIGHDEPVLSFYSNAPGSGNNMQWEITLPKERALPATKTFENYITFWFGMNLCDPNSYPQNPCTPDSDKNIGFNVPNAAGDAFLEMQFYPPGFSPFITQISCDLQHWCASLHINSAECTFNFVFCNPNCEEPTNFAFIQMDGIPTGPPGPASQTNASFTPNDETLLMNQGDKLKVTIKDTPAGLLTAIDDQTTRHSGFMVASAANGFQSLDLHTCAPTNFSFHPEYATAKFGNFTPWAAGQNNIGFDPEVGHFQPGANGDKDKDDAPCFKGPTIPGCTGSDVDFDGTSYKPDWPDGTRNNATSVIISSVPGNGVGPVSAPRGKSNYTDPYPSMQFDTEVGASESTCKPSGAGCTVPPPGATFYPFFAQSGFGSQCVFTVGNDIRGATVNDFGRDAQYGKPNLPWFFGDFSSGVLPNSCTPHTN